MGKNVRVNASGIGIYGQLIKVLKAGSIQPWQRDAFEPWARDLEMHVFEEHRNADLTGPGLEYEEIEAEADNAQVEESEVEA